MPTPPKSFPGPESEIPEQIESPAVKRGNTSQEQLTWALEEYMEFLDKNPGVVRLLLQENPAKGKHLDAEGHRPDMNPFGNRFKQSSQKN